MISKEEIIRSEYPLHWAVFRNDFQDLSRRTPLMLAVTVGHLECARILLERGADATLQSADFWSVSQEAICLGNHDFLQLILKYRDYQRALKRNLAMERLLNLLKETDDFYAEMSWEFTSWLPLVSKMCPSDTYKIYKRGSDVRIDTTLVGFDSSSNWKRGNQTFMFRVTDNNQPEIIIIDHTSKTAMIQLMVTSDNIADYEPSYANICSRLSSPVEVTYVDVDKIGFERIRTNGFFSWLTSSNLTETINGYECKVFNASNVELITKTRVEHLSEQDKERYKQEENSSALMAVLKLVENRQECTDEMKRTGSDVYCGLTSLQYLDKEYNMDGCDIGKPKQVYKKSNSFRATVWLCDQYPLDLQEQVMPIIDLMSVNNAHFVRLKNFIQLQLPAGFPVKVEIPLFHVVSARITFANVNKLGTFVSPFINDQVTIDGKAFEIPSDYHISVGDDFSMYSSCLATKFANPSGQIARRQIPEDELYLQFALEQSLREATWNDFTVENRDDMSSIGSAYDRDLALAIEESIRCLRLELSRSGVSLSPEFPDDEFNRVLRLSEEECEQRRRNQLEQDEELERVLQLSLIEK
ncbi:unnamed protein product [Dracunculus medinensis]|uniref:ANK_REP_REGION domain-containing protein n=1 Tax=Dracunculus medinensis TaxID=318479 RepID=A0A0N4UR81_DRAME|nr:unnamed protein product [Dracunculus medinensis]